MARQLTPITISATSSRIVSIDGTPQLDSTELITAVAIVDADGLTITNEAKSTVALVINQVTVITARAMQMLIVTPAVGSYNVIFSITTDSTPIQIQVWDQPIEVV